jgi:chromosome segregation ATPase
MLNDLKKKYDESAAAHAEIKTQLAQLIAKKDSLAEEIAGLDDELAGIKRAEVATMGRYVADEIAEADLIESRNAVKNADEKRQERGSFFDALTAAIEKAQADLKSAAADERRARDIFWRQAELAERASVRDASLTAIKKAYLVTWHTSSAGYAPSLSKFVEDVLSSIIFLDSEKEALRTDLVREYGVPL